MCNVVTVVSVNVVLEVVMGGEFGGGCGGGGDGGGCVQWDARASGQNNTHRP